MVRKWGRLFWVEVPGRVIHAPLTYSSSVLHLLFALICRDAPSVLHLLFADDCFLFIRACEQEATVMKNILSTYEVASGQVISARK